MDAYFIDIENSEDKIVYFPNSIRFFCVDKKNTELIQGIQKGLNYEELSEKYGISKYAFNFAYELLNENIGCSDLENTGYISRLTINLTNNCNLKCRYCYAHGGSYACESEYMTVETAKKVIDRFAEKFNNIYMIQFFGGEPLLNPDTFEFLCSYICELSKKGVLNPGIGERPRMVLMTNFTAVNDRILDIIDKYGVSVTVSLDGPETINGVTRIMKNGESQLEIVKKNIEALRKKTNGRQPTLIESTYTGLHIQADISVVDVVSFFHDELGMKRVHLLPAMVDPDSDCYIGSYDFLTEAAKEILELMKCGKDYRFDKLDDNFTRLKHRPKPRRFVCDAGQSQYSVSTEGDIYPCYALAGDPDLIMGNVCNEDVFSSEDYLRKRGSYAKMDRLKREPCASCFGRMACHGCMAIYKSLGNDIFEPSETVCRTFCDILKMTMLYMAENEDHRLDLFAMKEDEK